MILRIHQGLLIIRNFEEVIEGRSTIAASTVSVFFGGEFPARYLAVHGNKFAVDTVRASARVHRTNLSVSYG